MVVVVTVAVETADITDILVVAPLINVDSVCFFFFPYLMSWYAHFHFRFAHGFKSDLNIILSSTNDCYVVLFLWQYVTVLHIKAFIWVQDSTGTLCWMQRSGVRAPWQVTVLNLIGRGSERWIKLDFNIVWFLFCAEFQTRWLWLSVLFPCLTSGIHCWLVSLLC